MVKKVERGFKYQKRTKDDLKERANMKGGNYDSYIKPKYKQWKPKDGKNLIRILPPSWKDARHYGLDIFVNFNIGADNQSYLSLSKHDRGEDPLVEAKREAQKEGDKELAKALTPSQRTLYWLIDRMDEDEGPLLWAAPFTFDKSLSNLCIDVDTKEVMFIDDPETGCDVRFYKEGSGILTKYDPSKMKVMKSSLIHDDEGVQDEWLEFIQDNPLPDTLNFYDYDYIKATFDGQAGRKDENDDEDEKPARGVRAKRTERDSEEDDVPTRLRQTGSVRGSEDDDDEIRPRNRKGSRDADEDDVEETKPARDHRPSKEIDEDEAEEVRPRSRRQVVDDDEDEDPPSTRRTKRSTNDDESNGSIRDRLTARRRSRSTDD